VNQNVCLVINEVNAYIGTLGPLQVHSLFNFLGD